MPMDRTNEVLFWIVAQTVKRLSAMQETWVRSLGWEDPLEKEMATYSSVLAWKIPQMEETGRLQSMGSQDWETNTFTWASLVAQLIKNPPAMRETRVQSLGWEDPLEKGKATHSSILAWRIPWTVQSLRLQRVGHNWWLSLSNVTKRWAKLEHRVILTAMLPVLFSQ